MQARELGPHRRPDDREQSGEVLSMRVISERRHSTPICLTLASETYVSPSATARVSPATPLPPEVITAVDISPLYMVMPGQKELYVRTPPHTSTPESPFLGMATTPEQNGSYLVSSFTIVQPLSTAGRASRRSCVPCNLLI